MGGYRLFHRQFGTRLDAEVVEKIDNSPYGGPVVKVESRMTTQDGDTILKGWAEVGLP